ncbi:hypothetical protein PG997_008045 [Apiospora hydei]|uniref:Uncharacterized protein n=1 Tax=Apiospora hydei TaxID=1337664 RepID=A0ABR1WB13_9PEZI
MSATANHPWTLSSPGVYTQTHDSFAQFFADWVARESESERTSLIVVSVVKIRARFRSSSDTHPAGPQIKDDLMQMRLKQAWTAMRNDHPGLAVEFGPNHSTYKVPTQKDDLVAWLDATFLVHPGLDARGLTRSLKREAQPRLHWLPKTGEVVLTMHHCYADARSTWVFWDALLEKVVKGASPAMLDLEKSTKPPNLPPSRDDLLGLPSWPSIQGWLKAHDLLVSAMKLDLVLLPPSTTIPAAGESKDWLSGPGDFVRHSISESRTAAVVAGCKARGITVAAAFYAALASATRALQETERAGSGGSHAVTFHHFDVRPWLQATGNTNRVGLGVDYHVIIPFALGMIIPSPVGAAETKGEETVQERSLDELAHDMNEFFQTTRHEFGQDPTGLDALTHYVHSMFVPSTPAPSAPIFSSLGVAEHFIRRSFSGREEGEEVCLHESHGCEGEEEESFRSSRGPTLELEVEDTYVMTLGAKLMNCVILHTFRGRIWALSGFDESYFRDSVLEGLLAGTFEKLLAWLDVE